MQIGDRVRDKGTKFVGTIIQFDPPKGAAVRCLIQADDVSRTGIGHVGDPPPDKLWQKVDEVELVDMEGNSVTGKAVNTTVNTSGGRVDAAGNPIETQAGGTFDAKGNRIKSTQADAAH